MLTLPTVRFDMRWPWFHRKAIAMDGAQPAPARLETEKGGSVSAFRYPVGGLSPRLKFHPDADTFVRVTGFDPNPGPANAGKKQGARFHLDPGAGAIFIADPG